MSRLANHNLNLQSDYRRILSAVVAMDDPACALDNIDAGYCMDAPEIVPAGYTKQSETPSFYLPTFPVYTKRGD